MRAPAFADVAYVSNEKGGVSVVDLTRLTVVQELDVGGQVPRGIGITDDGTYILTANKTSNDMSVIDAKSGTLVRRLPLGRGPEFLRVRGDFAYVTYEPGGMREEEESERDYDKEPPAEVAIVDLKTWKVMKSVKSGLETEGIEFSQDGSSFITTNEGDETISVYETASGKKLKTIHTKPYGKRPRGIKRMPDGKGYAVTFENTSSIVLFDNDFKILKQATTKLGPNGVGFDPSGKLMLVAASRASTLQIFNASTLELVKEIPIGRRCWHFTYTPDGKRILVACGRSDELQIINADTYRPEASISGFKMPWGVVTAPRGFGSLDLP